MAQVFDFSKPFNDESRQQFADLLVGLSAQMGFKVSSRGWCYTLEQERYINKDQFDRVADAVNDLRRRGYLPVDFIKEDAARNFEGIQTEYHGDVDDVIEWMTRDVLDGGKYFTPDYWEGEEYYIQVKVEKIDLVTLFEPVCRAHCIPIGNAKGSPSIYQRADEGRRFAEAEARGLKCVLLYCGDLDADGLRLGDNIYSNLDDLKRIFWTDGTQGYDPKNLIIERFGLNYDFVQANSLTWIDNLITGSGRNLADPKHKNHHMDYVQNYLRTIGERKCEANALVTRPRQARALMLQAIEKYLGKGAAERFTARRQARIDEYTDRLEELGLGQIIRDFRETRGQE